MGLAFSRLFHWQHLMSCIRLQNNVDEDTNEVGINSLLSLQTAGVMNKTDSENQSCIKLNGNGQVVENCSNAVKRRIGNSEYKDIMPNLNVCNDSQGSLIPNSKSRKVCVDGGETENNNVDDKYKYNHSEMHLNSLPVSLLLKIFSYITMNNLVHKISLVCKFWHQLAFDSELWREIVFQRHIVNDEVLKKVTSISSNVTCIKIPDCRNKNLTDDGIIAVASTCPNLHTFVAPRSGSKLSDVAFVALTEHCPKLRKIDLDCLNISDQTLSSIAWHSKGLEYLSLCQITDITNQGVSEVIRRCRHLEVLILNQNSQLTDDCIHALPQSSCSLVRLELMMCGIIGQGVRLISHLTSVKHLNISQCLVKEAIHLNPVLQSCRQLNILSLNLNKSVDDRCVDSIVSSLLELTHIYLVSTVITDDAMISMGVKGKKLRRVDVGYTKVTAEGARQISELCSDLTYLGLMRCDLVEEAKIDELAQIYPKVRYSTFLMDTKRLLQQAGILDSPT